MRLTQAELNRYRKEVDAAADSAGAYVMDVMESFSRVYPSADTASMRNFVVEVLQASLPNFCDAAATLSADLFDEIAEALGVEADTRLYDTIDYGKVEQKVRYFAKFLNEGDAERFKREVADVTRYYVKRSAFENMRENCKGQKVKWARVPTGFETCPFCFMLASRGFVYGNEKKAMVDHETGDKYHVHCDCIAVPGFEDERGNPRVKIDGYDPQTMYENWCDCARTVGIDPQRKKTAWTDEERKAVMREVETRDWHWLYTGKPVSVDYSAKPYGSLEEWEKKAADCLSQKHGISLKTIKEDDNASANLDFAMLGKAWELKSPKSGKHAVDDRLTDAFSKFKKLKSRDANIVICNSESTRADEDVLDECLRRISYRKNKGEFSSIDFIFLSHDGSKLRRYKI